MRPVLQTLDAAEVSNWLPVDYRGGVFGIGIGCTVSSGGTLTYSVQHTFDDPFAKIPITISRTTTTATVTFSNPHGKSAGDSIIVSGTGESNLDGEYDIASVGSTTTLTYTVADTGATTASGKAAPLTVFNHDTLTALTATADGGYDLPPAAVRAEITAYTDGILQVNYRFLSR